MLHVAGDDGFIGHYLRYARGVTDAPLASHVAAALGILGAAVGSRLTWTGGGGHEQWPNLYLLIIAPSGIYRKSTSIDLGASLLTEACPGSVMDREFSRERFIRNLAEHPSSLLKEAEFSSLLARMDSAYMNGTKPLFTELYDCMESYDRHIQGSGDSKSDRVRILRPSLSILAASTADWLVSSLTETDLRSGFLPRFLFFPGNEREPEPVGGYWATPDPADRRELVGALKLISQIPKAHLNVSQVSQYLIGWDNQVRARYDPVTMGNLSGVYSRLAHAAAKICALLSVSDLDHGSTEYVVTMEIAERATSLMEWVLESTERVFEEHLVFEKFEQLAQKCLRLISEEGIDRSRLLKAMKISSKQLDSVLDTLQDRDQIDVDVVKTSGRERTVLRRLDPEGKKGKEGERSGEESPVPDAYVSAFGVPGGVEMVT